MSEKERREEMNSGTKNDVNRTETKNVAWINRKIPSTPFLPYCVISEEIVDFFSYVMRQRSYPRITEFERDLSIIKDCIELLLVTRSIEFIVLDTVDMRMKIKLIEDPYEGEAKLSRPIVIPKPLSSDVKPVLTIEAKDMPSSLMDQLSEITQSANMQVLKVALKKTETPQPPLDVRRLCCETLPKFGVNLKLSDEHLDSVAAIINRNEEHIKALSLIADKNVRIIMPTFVVKNPGYMKHFSRLWAEVPPEVKDYSIGVFSDVELEDCHLNKSMESHYRDLYVGPFPGKEKFFHYVVSEGEEECQG